MDTHGMSRCGVSFWSLAGLLGAVALLVGLEGWISPNGGFREGTSTILRGNSRVTNQMALSIGTRTISDTIDRPVVDPKACTQYQWFREHEVSKWEDASFPIGRNGNMESLHELTCRWTTGQRTLSLSPSRLPKYVRPMGNSIRLSDDVLAYPVQMVQLREGPTARANTLYYVAEVGDSLYYREIADARPKNFDPSTVSVRAHRLLDVAEAEAKYIWFEYAKSQKSDDSGTPTSIEEWNAHVFSYDASRGMRHLAFTAIRREERKNGEFHGARQLDVSIPQAGIMDVEERLQQGAKVTKGRAWNRFLGRHIIDTTVVDDPPPPPPE